MVCYTNMDSADLRVCVNLLNEGRTWIRMTAFQMKLIEKGREGSKQA